MPVDLRGKVAVITGAASGIGLAAVRRFLDAGARVVAVDREPMPEGDPDRLRHVVGDVAAEATAIAYARAAVDAFGRLDVMVNNAGVGCSKKIHDHSEADWDRIFAINVKALYWSARHVVPVMLGQGGGLFLNTGSISSVVGIPLQGAYGPSKGAVIQITRQMAVEYAADGIRANAVCPGTVETPLVRAAAVESGDPAGFMHSLETNHPIGRIADPDEIAAFFAFLASDDARFITGAVLMIDGGFTAR